MNAGSTVDPRRVRDAIQSVRERIRQLAGDRPVQLIAVTKGFGADAIDAAAANGCDAIGENYAQELIAKLATRAAPAADVDVHFIGQLQTNKVRAVADVVAVWQTVDRAGLANEIARRAPGSPVFVQVNTTGETGKGGCVPADTTYLVEYCTAVGLSVQGLMTVGPTSVESRATAAAFALLHSLADDNGLVACSMGMSADLEIALEHGATHVRLGSVLFGERPQRGARIG